MELLENTGMNKYAIELIDGKQLLYEPIYAFSPVKLKTIKAYIKTHLKTMFIQPSKSFANTSIFFNKMPDNSFCLYVDYQSLNNLIIKNQYPLLLIGEALNCLGRAK